MYMYLLNKQLFHVCEALKKIKVSCGIQGQFQLRKTKVSFLQTIAWKHILIHSASPSPSLS